MNNAERIFTAIEREDKEVTVTDDHLKLARRSFVGWNDVEHGAPSLDPKRPYGNSDVYGDIAELVDGVDLRELDDRDGWDSYLDAHVERFDRLHAEMAIVMQILMVNLAIETGTYRRQGYGNKWSKVN